MDGADAAACGWLAPGELPFAPSAAEAGWELADGGGAGGVWDCGWTAEAPDGAGADCAKATAAEPMKGTVAMKSRERLRVFMAV